MTPNGSIDSRRLDRPATFPSRDEIDWHIARSRRIRAEAAARLLSSAGRALTSPARRLAAPALRWQRRRQTYELLMRCSDRVLADIGIERETIPLITRGRDPHGSPARPSVAGWWRTVRLRREALRQARREWRRAYDELMAYDDRELDEIGIRRVDIPSILRGRAPAPAFG